MRVVFVTRQCWPAVGGVESVVENLGLGPGLVFEVVEAAFADTVGHLPVQRLA